MSFPRCFLSSANLLFLFLLLLGPVVSVSSSNWIVCWAGVELSFLGLIPLLFLGNKYISLTKESSMKYFCIQALGSAILFYSGMVMFSDLGGGISALGLAFSILIKLGIFPMHFWVPGVAAGLSLVTLYLVLTVQKVAPFAFLMLVCSDLSSSLHLVILGMAAASSLVGAFIGLNQTDLRAMLGCSSVAHSGWLTLGCLSGFFWGYFGIYCLSLMFVFYFLLSSSSEVEKGLGLLSLSGLPPFIMFLGKWGVLKSALEMHVPVWVLPVFLISAVISLAFYLKFSYSFILSTGNLVSASSNKLAGVLFLLVNFTGLFYFLFV